MAKTLINNRQIMEKAIEEMKKTIHEHREDGKVCPSVGAVLVKPDGSMEFGFRSEFRNGDHAEYTILERKKGKEILDGSTLFTTLEPCAPGSRAPGKSSCAERILAARIKEVWMGIEDPDPQVAGKGKAFLESNGISVYLFDPDLQQEIRAFNNEFINQALLRAEEYKKNKPQESHINIFDHIYPEIEFSDYSIEAIEYYRQKANIKDTNDSQDFRKRLIQQGLLSISGKEKEVATGLGILLFSSHPRDYFPQTGLTVTIQINSSKEEIKDFYGPLILIPEELERWLEKRFPRQLVRDRMIHIEKSMLPIPIIRESIINALIHRDYEIIGSKCHLDITEKAIVIKSPGPPVKPITIDLLNSFKAPMFNRNPRLAYIFSLCGLSEERGLGMRTFSNVNSAYSLPNPHFEFVDPFLTFRLDLSTDLSLYRVPGKIVNHLSNDEKVKLESLFRRGEFTRLEYQNTFGLNYRTAQRQISDLITSGSIIQINAGRSTRYKVER